jgi:Zn-dependent protease
VFGSLEIANFLGIRVRLHWTFVVLVVVMLLVGWPFSAAWLNVSVIGGLFGIVLLHELGHGFVARRFGLQVVDVTLWPLGGLTRMSRIPENSRIEGWIAFAGPAVNLALTLLALPFLAEGALTGALKGEFVRGSGLEVTAGLFAAANLSLALFNLLPAFPLDGGRLARALIGLRTDWVSATRAVARMGQWIALAMIAYGIYSLAVLETGSWMLPLFGVFLWASGVREVWNVRLRHAGSEFARAMGIPVDPPVEASPAPASPRPGAAAEAADDPSGARRPGSQPVFEGARGERLSDEQIAALERFRGRIGRAPAGD